MKNTTLNQNSRKQFNLVITICAWLVILLYISTFPILSIETKEIDQGNRLCLFENGSSTTIDLAKNFLLEDFSSGGRKRNRNPGAKAEKWLTFSAYIDSSYRKTQFFELDHNSLFFQGDSRLELWIPPFRSKFSWGFYIRLAIAASNTFYAWENRWLARPGFGFHLFPFSSKKLRKEGNLIGQIFGPLRLFVEYNFMGYWCPENSWRPDKQFRFGCDYWKALHINNINKSWWLEVWAGLYKESANEIDKNYNSLILANAVNFGLRKADTGIFSLFSPYALIESSITKNKEYYWENRFSAGGGIRIAAPVEKWFARGWLSRLIIFVEYRKILVYYHDAAPTEVPDFDFRVGLGFTIGEWYR